MYHSDKAYREETRRELHKNVTNYIEQILRGCGYEIIVEMKEAMTKVIDTLAQEDFHRTFQKLLELYNKCIAAGGDYFEGD